jgi:Holliday junction resolvase
MRVPKRIGGEKSTAARRSPKQEKDIANRLGGKVVRGSGRGNEKGDVRLKGVLRIEAKTTSKDSFRVTKEMAEKIEMQAMSSGECPAIVVEFLDKNGKPEHELAVVPMWVLNSIANERIT